MPYPVRELRSGLKAKGSRIEKDGGDYYARYYYNGKIRTKVRSKVGGHSKRKYKDLWDELLRLISLSLQLEDKSQLIDLLECPMSQAKYQARLLALKKIQLPPKPAKK